MLIHLSWLTLEGNLVFVNLILSFYPHIYPRTMVRSEDLAHRRLETQNSTPHPPCSLLFLALVTRLAPSLYSAKIFFIPTLSLDPKVSQQVLSAHVL